ncbi:hypothetical protein [Streptacidiphilus neutrinimicus]|uniref:hypothetical protein n=1 Tax=Streptacidiphilus neutrinimicus TaxID=105420 RepID=UPI000AB4FD98|nr:hypothetical protein [Streptacidiphilus neutrinimicus]
MFRWVDRSSRASRAQVFRCGYCHGKVRADRARIEKVRGVQQYVHAWHPSRGQQ